MCYQKNCLFCTFFSSPEWPLLLLNWWNSVYWRKNLMSDQPSNFDTPSTYETSPFANRHTCAVNSEKYTTCHAPRFEWHNVSKTQRSSGFLLSDTSQQTWDKDMCMPHFNQKPADEWTDLIEWHLSCCWWQMPGCLAGWPWCELSDLYSVDIHSNSLSPFLIGWMFVCKPNWKYSANLVGS